MKIQYSPHAKKRLKQRGITKDQARLAVLNSDYAQQTDRNRIIARKKLNGKTLEIIYVKENGKIIVITLYYL